MEDSTPDYYLCNLSEYNNTIDIFLFVFLSVYLAFDFNLPISTDGSRDIPEFGVGTCRPEICDIHTASARLPNLSLASCH